ncbi:DUF3617 family protein [Sphingomonas arenae]|nr:DUF3617 family protein [Sphingomonas arenae]
MRLAGLVAVGAIALVGAAPVALKNVAGGRWEVSRSATGHGATRVCVADPAMLAQFEHRGGSCTRVILSDRAAETIIHYTCQGGDFGRTKVTVITPRSLRLETQGISSGLPFSYQLHARRVGNC